MRPLFQVAYFISSWFAVAIAQNSEDKNTMLQVTNELLAKRVGLP